MNDAAMTRHLVANWVNGNRGDVAQVLSMLPPLEACAAAVRVYAWLRDDWGSEQADPFRKWLESMA